MLDIPLALFTSLHGPSADPIRAPAPCIEFVTRTWDTQEQRADRRVVTLLCIGEAQKCIISQDSSSKKALLRNAAPCYGSRRRCHKSGECRALDAMAGHRLNQGAKNGCFIEHVLNRN